ncbi:MAG: hypothetical protein EB000_03700, partial [Alphaproteobacteria bacterium]|nr:hypothetical protein [Alphaproteobacteria bacterium]
MVLIYLYPRFLLLPHFLQWYWLGENEIFKFTEKMKDQVAASDIEVQELVKEHYEFCLQFWRPTKEAYKSLATTYILPSDYRDSYEEVATGLGKYHYDAICIWAD